MKRSLTIQFAGWRNQPCRRRRVSFHTEMKRYLVGSAICRCGAGTATHKPSHNTGSSCMTAHMVKSHAPTTIVTEQYRHVRVSAVSPHERRHCTSDWHSDPDSVPNLSPTGDCLIAGNTKSYLYNIIRVQLREHSEGCAPLDALCINTTLNRRYHHETPQHPV
jgi:hypothetical protein